MLRMSAFLKQLSVINGDPVYSLRVNLIAPYRTVNITPDQKVQQIHELRLHCCRVGIQGH